jgi:ABC-type sugar transport system permease subunit
MNAQRMKRHLAGYLFLAPYLILFGAFLLTPLFYGLLLSFYRWEMISPAPPRWTGLENYREALSDRFFYKSLGATLRFVVMSVPLNLACALGIALGLNTLGGRRAGWARAAYFVPLMVSISVAGILWRWFYNSEFGLFNALLAHWDCKVAWISDPGLAMKSIVLMSLWWTLGGQMVVLLAGLQNIPRHYYEAAAIDGAGAFAQFRHVTIPLLRPVLLFVVVMSIIGAFQIFGQTFVITSGGPEFATRVLVQYIYETAFNHYRMGYGAAMSWLLFAVIAIFSVLQFTVLKER